MSLIVAVAVPLSMMPFTQEGRKGHWEWKGLIVLLGSSVFQAVGILFFWSAIKTGQVTQVIPLSRLSLLLIIFLSWLLFRKEERLNFYVVAGAILICAGAAFVTMARG